jgi:hypothetical protein
VKRIFLVFAAALCLSTLSAGQQAPETSTNPSTQHASKHHHKRHHSKKRGGKHQHPAHQPTS